MAASISRQRPTLWAPNSGRATAQPPAPCWSPISTPPPPVPPPPRWAIADGPLFFRSIEGAPARELGRVLPANKPPVASNDVYAALEDTALVVAAPGVLNNDTDPNNDDLSAIVVGNP